MKSMIQSLSPGLLNRVEQLPHLNLLSQQVLANDLLLEDPDALVIMTSSILRDDPHLKDVRHSQLVSMVEVADDSYIFFKSLESLQHNTLAMERFQFAYGWLTQWAKLRAYVLLAPGDHPDTIKFQLVSTGIGVNPLDITEHDVTLVRDDLDFLRTKVNDPVSHFMHALLSLQLVKKCDWDALDMLVIWKVHNAHGFPFQCQC